MIAGETILSGAPGICPTCGVHVKDDFHVMVSEAGWFVGTACCCGPVYSRETEYFETREAAQESLRRYVMTGGVSLPGRRT